MILVVLCHHWLELPQANDDNWLEAIVTSTGVTYCLTY